MLHMWTFLLFLSLVTGTSMGGMYTWMWGSRYPDFVDALMPLASLPTQIAGRNRVWRSIVADTIRKDPEWKEGIGDWGLGIRIGSGIRD